MGREGMAHDSDPGLGESVFYCRELCRFGLGSDIEPTEEYRQLVGEMAYMESIEPGCLEGHENELSNLFGSGVVSCAQEVAQGRCFILEARDPAMVKVKKQNG